MRSPRNDSKLGHEVRAGLSGTLALHVLALWTLAVTHPLLAVLALPSHVPFFAAHQARNVDI
jgi:hypothetical protein